MKNWLTIIATFLLVIFVRIVVTKEQTVLAALSSGQYREAWLGFKAILPTRSPPARIVTIPAITLKDCAQGYVDTPLYHTGGWLMRWIQWGKLRALWKLRGDFTGTCLDFGCGNGVMLPTLAEHFDQVVGFDLHTEAACALKVDLELDNVEIRRAPQDYLLPCLPFWDNHFDTVWASSAFEHIEHLYIHLTELYRVLKPGGQLLCLSPSEDWLYQLGRKLCKLQKPADHYHTGKEIHEALQQYFTCEVKKTWPPLLGTYVMGRYRKG